MARRSWCQVCSGPLEEASWRAGCDDEDRREDGEGGTRRGVQVGV